MKNQTYSELLRQYYDWQWEADFRLAHQDDNGYLFACKQMTKYEHAMREMPAVNTFKPCKITFWHLSRMCDNVLAKERIELDKGNWQRAASLSLVWARIMKAMINPYYFNS